MLAAKQDLLRTVDPIRDIEGGFDNFGKDLGPKTDPQAPASVICESHTGDILIRRLQARAA